MGKDKDTLNPTYKTIGRPIASYVLPIKEHTIMLGEQCAFQCHHPVHPNHDLTSIRASTLTFASQLSTSKTIRPLTARSREATTAIHTSIVEETLDSYHTNRVLKAPPRAISSEET